MTLVIFFPPNKIEMAQLFKQLRSLIKFSYGIDNVSKRLVSSNFDMIDKEEGMKLLGLLFTCHSYPYSLRIRTFISLAVI